MCGPNSARRRASRRPSRAPSARRPPCRPRAPVAASSVSISCRPAAQRSSTPTLQKPGGIASCSFGKHVADVVVREVRRARLGEHGERLRLLLLQVRVHAVHGVVREEDAGPERGPTEELRGSHQHRALLVQPARDQGRVVAHLARVQHGHDARAEFVDEFGARRRAKGGAARSSTRRPCAARRHTRGPPRAPFSPHASRARRNPNARRRPWRRGRRARRAPPRASPRGRAAPGAPGPSPRGCRRAGTTARRTGPWTPPSCPSRLRRRTRRARRRSRASRARPETPPDETFHPSSRARARETRAPPAAAASSPRLCRTDAESSDPRRRRRASRRARAPRPRAPRPRAPRRPTSASASRATPRARRAWATTTCTCRGEASPPPARACP